MTTLRGRLAAVSVLIVLSASAPASAQVARVFLSGTGSDTNDCTNASTPCRSLQGAVNQCPAGGEVIVTSSGGFGAATITTSMTINAPSGVVAFDARTITVTIGTTDKVVIRGLSMNGSAFGDHYGIDFTSGGTLVVENSTIASFLYGIAQEGAGSALVLHHCTLRNNSNGVFSQFATGTALATLTVEDSRFENNSSYGVVLSNYVRGVVTNTVATGNAVGYAIQLSAGGGGALLLDGVVATNNTYGIYALGENFTFATARVTNSTISGNVNGMVAALYGQVISQGNNHVWANTAGETFSLTESQQ